MTSKRYLGNIITDTPTTPTGPYQDGVASGIWTLAEASDYTEGGLWPIAGNILSVAVFMGGSDGSEKNVIDKVTITTAGNATDFGDLTASKRNVAGAGSSTRAVVGGGDVGGTANNVIEYIELPTEGNGTDFGDLLHAQYGMGALSNNTRALFFGGAKNSGGGDADQNVIQYITIASTGNATDYGDMTFSAQRVSGTSSSTRGIMAGGGSSNTIQYVTIASTGNAIDFGDLTRTANHLASFSNGTRAVFTTGTVMDYITIASTGNATDFGDPVEECSFGSGTSSPTIGINSVSRSNSRVINYVTIATTGNGQDWGDLTVGREQLAASSNNHGGLQA